MTQNKKRWLPGPGMLVAAAFIGPGTVTTCTLAGANFGFALVWALVFATIATIILQSMATRLGLVGGVGLGQALLQVAPNKILRWILIALVLSALLVGNAAYEGGNISGAALGLETAFAAGTFTTYVVMIGALAALILAFGHYRLLEIILIGLVLIMSVAFCLTFILVQPDWGSFIKGFAPTLPPSSLPVVIGLIGTTIVPYNLFLHAASVRERWAADMSEAPSETLKMAQSDTVISIGLGGLVSIFILSTAAAGLFAQGLSVNNASDMALQLQPIFGENSKYLIGIGLAAAGLSSAITAPMASAYAVSECFGNNAGTRKLGFKLVALAVLSVGLVIALSGFKPLSIILFAQIANGLLLPIIAIFLILAMNNRKLLADRVNGALMNAVGIAVVLIATGLGLRLIWRVISG